MSRFAHRMQFAAGGSADIKFGGLYGRAITLHNPTLADSTIQTTAGTSRYTYTVQQSASKLWLTYMNWYNSSYKVAPYCTDTANTATITVQALVFAPGSSSGTPVTIDGATSWTIPSGGWVQTDPIKVNVAAGQQFDVQTYVSGTQWYPTLVNGGGFAVGNQATAGSTKVAASGGSLYTPSIVTGSRSGPSVLILGDSIAYSALGGSLGYIETGLSGHYAAINTSIAGDRLYWALGGRRTLSLFANNAATTAICEYCRNDLDDSRSVAQMQANLLTIWSTQKAARQRVVQTTITPHTNSTDGWTTTVNQTVANTTIEARRVELNTWIRAGAPIIAGSAVAPGTSGAVLAGDNIHPLYGYWEIADLVETARNSGIWKAGYTTDGLHPNSTGITAASGGVDDTMIA